VIVVVAAQVGRAVAVFGGDVVLVIHFLAEATAVPDLGGDGSELRFEIDLKEI
jgi:hypothetical protein